MPCAVLQAEAVHVGEENQQPGELLAALDDAELGGLLDGVDGVAAGIRHADDLGLRGLCLQQERREVLVRERMAYRAHYLAARGLDEFRYVAFERMAERIVGGEEEPGVAAGLDQLAAGADGQRVGVVGPVNAVGRALAAGEVGGRAGRYDDQRLLLLAQDFLHRQHRRGVRQVAHQIDVFDVEPPVDDVGGDVRLVLVVGVDELDRLAQRLAAEVLDRHARRGDAAHAREVGVDAGLIVDDADLDRPVGWADAG